MSGAGSVSGRGLRDPSVLCQAQERCPGCLAADAGQEGQAAGVGFQGAAESVQGEDAQHVENATVCRTSSTRPTAGCRVRALLHLAHVRGDRVGAPIKRGVVPDLPVTGRDVAHRLIPLAGKHTALAVLFIISAVMYVVEVLLTAILVLPRVPRSEWTLFESVDDPASL